MATLNATDTKVRIEIACPDCDGNGFKIGVPDTVPNCDTCNGAGRFTTDMTANELAMHLSVSSHRDISWNEVERT